MTERDIKKIANEHREKNGNSEITNKELLWYVVHEFDELKDRVSTTESRQTMMCWFIPVCIGFLALVIKLL